MFITFEGTEGSGKSTQAARLAEDLRREGRDVVATREPGGTELTIGIRKLLADPDSHVDRRAELLLFLADRAQHVATVIAPALERGAVVISDRYSDSTLAYQGYGRGHDLEWLQKINAWASLDTVPDLTLWLDCEPEEGLRRVEEDRRGPRDRFEREPLEFHRRVREGLVELQRSSPERIVRIDALLGVDEMARVVRAEVEPRLP